MVKLSQYNYLFFNSIEDFCSDSCIVKIVRSFALKKIHIRKMVPYCKNKDLSTITTKTIADAADAGDKTAIKAYEISAKMLGRTCAMTIDILNPEVIIIGSVFQRSEIFSETFLTRR